MEYRLVVPGKTPKTNKKTFTVYFPDFMEDIKPGRIQRGNRTQTTVTMLRNTLLAIAERYNQSFEVYSTFKGTDYEGINFNSEKEYSDIIVNIVKTNYPKIIDAAIAAQIAKVPKDVELIEFIAEDLIYTSAFSAAGIHMFTENNEKKLNSQKNKRYNNNIQEQTTEKSLNEEIENG